MIDGGGQLKTSKASKSSDKNTGSYVLKPYLAAKGYHHIDGIFISHSDYDHIYGIIEVIKEIQTDFIVLPSPYKTQPDKLINELLIEAEKHHVQVHYFSEGDCFTYKNLNFQCLYPYKTTMYEKNNNCNSMVLKVDFKAFNGLFTGDIEAPQENTILQKQQTEVELIKVPHHGSDTSSTQSFLRQFAPKTAVFSYGKNNFYGHPSESVVESYLRQDVVSYHIARKGAVLLKTNGKTFYIRSYLSNRKDKYICSN